MSRWSSYAGTSARRTRPRSHGTWCSRRTGTAGSGSTPASHPGETFPRRNVCHRFWSGPRRTSTSRSASAASRRAAVSPRTLARLFERHLATTPGKWLLRRRIQEACSLLERTDTPVDVVAAAAGFPTRPTSGVASPTNWARRPAPTGGPSPSPGDAGAAVRPQ
ncbi:helix-turn-helix domain-containing protein [Actinoallomurus sp. NPDC050550]|uniref:helix-turn-helix domain-containing protein n=1 Tax=Actinoallomurus sp. NPDC050550 TaxID=3154937 RepID=UPI0033C0A9FB